MAELSSCHCSVARIILVLITMKSIFMASGVDVCVNISENSKPIADVFNGSYAACRDCIYLLAFSGNNDSQSIASSKLFEIDRFTGVLRLNRTRLAIARRSGDLARRTHIGIITYKKNDFDPVSHSRLNLTVIFATENCLSVSNWSRSALSTNADFYFKITAYALLDGSCIPADSEILRLQNLLPWSLISSCEIGFNLGSHNELFFLNRKLGSLRTAVKFCVPSSAFNINAFLTTNCSHSFSVLSGMYHLHLVLSPVLQPVYYKTCSGFSCDQKDKSKARFRRAVANKPPYFSQRQFFHTVPEEAESGYEIATITAYDPDQGSAGKLTYSLLASKDRRSQTMFTVDKDTGAIRTVKRLDREEMADHHFRLIAKDAGKPPMSAEVSLTIHVKDINDHMPVFESSLYSKAVSEGISIGTTILTVRASDEDSELNGEIEYSILNQQDVGDILEIDPYVGSIVTKASLDREKRDQYRLEIVATDSSQDEERHTATAVVEIVVLDENDNRPQFMNETYVVEVREDIDYTMVPVIAQIMATDLDAGSNGIIRYNIIGGNFLNTFSIDSESGKLSLMAALDYEKMRMYQLNIRAQDLGSPPKSNTKTVVIKVLDANDNDPKFDMPFYQESVLENIPVGNTILRLRAYDADYGPESEIKYSINDPLNDMPIAINNTSGSIYTVSALDRERQGHYRFDVEAQDYGVPPRTATAVVEIIVRDVNDNAPVFNPRVYHEIVSEEALPGMPVVMVTAQDADENENARIVYSFKSGNERGSFSIISQMGCGLISIANTLSFKQQSRYFLVVTASDSVFEDSATVYINISDANLHRPIFVKTPYMFRVNEDAPVGTVVFNVSATDHDTGDNARITFTMQESKEFAIDSVTGNVLLLQALDRELVAGYMLTVTATDHGRPSKSDTTDIEVVVLDVNDNAPKFLKASYSGRVDEDAQIGMNVLSVHAVDEDAGLNKQIRYSFEGGENGNGDFLIEPSSGIIRTARELDRERTSRYDLRLFAIDQGQPQLSTSVNVTVVVADVNDNAPQFLSSNIWFFINENSPIGSYVGSVQATDADDGFNADIEYTISGGLDADSFLLNVENQNSSATITTLTDLDYEGEKKEYVIYVRARSFHLFSDAIVRILVQDVNDNIPQLKDFVIIFNNYKDYFHSGHIGHVPASDPDVSDKLHYRFVSGNQANLLHLNSENGFISLDSRLNSDMPTNGTLKVSVTDGINEVRAICRLYVHLVTEEMLVNSVTVRLRNIHQLAFLSPFYNLFVSSLASIIPTSEDNIVIIGVLDDTDVEETILNVTFSVRQKVEHGHDVFYSQQFLREKVYLQRLLLAKLSNLEVLPFDDNLCIREPCLNFEECYSMLRFGNTSAAVGSDVMLFRSIIPANTFGCKCPVGFTGMESEYLCDTEVNLCYSSPCEANGTCVQREGGYHCTCPPDYTGAHCEIEINHGSYAVCPRNICRAPSRCVPRTEGGFWCELCGQNGSCVDCAKLEHYNKFCELRVRNFNSNAYLMLAPLRQRHRFNISLSVATKEMNALLFYDGRYNERHDFIALEIVSGQVRFSFSLGSEVIVVNTSVEGTVSDGVWRRINVYFLNRTATVSVGDNCDTELSIQHGHKIGNYHCAGRATHVLDEKCRDVTETCHRFLDLSGPFFLGGISWSSSNNIQIQNHHFVGCIRDLYIDSKLIDLNSYAWQNGTSEGCPQKNDFCKSSPCQNSDTCINGWESYICDCASTWTGKDCSQRAVDGAWKLSGAGVLVYSKEKHGLSNVQLPWCNGLSFRTQQANATLMTVDLGARLQDSTAGQIRIEILNGFLQYVFPHLTVVVDHKPVNDGLWHYMETRWLHDRLIVTVDYGQMQVTRLVSDWVSNRPVGRIVVGGKILTDDGDNPETGFRIAGGLEGCVKAIRVGSNLGFLLASPEEVDAEPGCNMSDACALKDSCPKNVTVCVSEFGKPACKCRPGRIGRNCHRICDRFSPCHGGQCVDSPQTEFGYSCKCDSTHTGQYCSEPVKPSCPASWWSTPICGPCNCPRQRGFDPNCNKVTGQCNCRVNHYRVGDLCLPCDCYEVGSVGRSCNPVTGQCTCRSNVIGRQCDSCSSRFAEVTLRGCEVIYDACPRTFWEKIWWERTPFGSVVQQSCPENMRGIASRVCNETEGWLEPNLGDCTSSIFVELREQLTAVEEKRLIMNTFVAKGLLTRLSYATQETMSLYEMDIRVALRLIISILHYETSLSGLNLTHMQDRSFVQNLANSVGQIVDERYSEIWMSVNQKVDGKIMELMKSLTDYVFTLARNMPFLFTQPFDAVHKNIVLGLDFIGVENQSTVAIPKYNNKVQNPDIFDAETKALLSVGSLRVRRAADPATVDLSSNDQPIAFVGYVMYRMLGNLLPSVYDDSVKLSRKNPLAISSLVFTLAVIDHNDRIKTRLDKPINIEFYLNKTNRSNPQCVHWKYDKSSSDGYWSADECTMTDVRESASSLYVVCECNLVSTYAVVMEIGENTEGEKYQVCVGTYVGLSIALVVFTASLIVFCLIGSSITNSNSIHIHLVGTLVVANLVFVLGIDEVEPLLTCRIVAITLHFAFMCSFMWLFAEILHVYRRMTDIRDVNHGTMGFYYVIGYVVPGIIVTLAVALDTDGYGNQQFCWLKMEPLLWSLAGPICCVFVFSVVICAAAACVVCQGRSKHADADMSYLRYSLKVNLIYLPLQSLAWLFALLNVNNSLVPAFRYLFLIFTCLQSAFILIAFIILSRETKRLFHYSWYKMRQGKDADDRCCITRNSHFSNSVLSFPSVRSSCHSGLDVAGRRGSGPPTPKSFARKMESGHLERHSSTQKQSMTFLSKGHLPGQTDVISVPPELKESFGRTASDSDSETSPGDPADVELASSHSSDEDDDVGDVYSKWNKSKKNGNYPSHSSTGKLQGKPRTSGSASGVTPGSSRGRTVAVKAMTHNDNLSSSSDFSASDYFIGSS